MSKDPETSGPALLRGSQGEIPHARGVSVWVCDGGSGDYIQWCAGVRSTFSQEPTVCVYLFPTPHSGMLYWWLDTGHVGTFIPQKLVNPTNQGFLSREPAVEHL